MSKLAKEGVQKHDEHWIGVRHVAVFGGVEAHTLRVLFSGNTCGIAEDEVRCRAFFF